MVIRVGQRVAGQRMTPQQERELENFFRGMEEQIPFASALALTRMAQDVRTSLQGHLRGVLDRPTRRTINSIRYTPADKKDQPPISSVWIVDEATKGTAPADYLAELITGGARRHKRHEKVLHRAGILPRGWYTVPGKDQRLNRFGNVTAGTYTKILSELRVSTDPMQNITGSRRSQAKRRGYFVLGSSRGRGGNPVGVYQRTSKNRIKSVLHFVPRATYSPRIDLEGPSQQVLQRRGRQHFLDAMATAYRSAQRRQQRQQQRQLEGTLRGITQGAAREAARSLG